MIFSVDGTATVGSQPSGGAGQLSDACRISHLLSCTCWNLWLSGEILGASPGFLGGEGPSWPNEYRGLLQQNIAPGKHSVSVPVFGNAVYLYVLFQLVRFSEVCYRVPISLWCFRAAGPHLNVVIRLAVRLYPSKNVRAVTLQHRVYSSMYSEFPYSQRP